MKSLKAHLFLIGVCGFAWWPITPAYAVTEIPISDKIMIGGSIVFTTYENKENAAAYHSNVLIDKAFSKVVVYLTEPVVAGIKAIPKLSDIAFVDDSLSLSFASDNESGFFPADVPGEKYFYVNGYTVWMLPETGLFQDVGTYFGLDAGYVQIQSDMETPLPAALPLFASGLGAFGLLGWRRKRKAKLAV